MKDMKDSKIQAIELKRARDPKMKKMLLYLFASWFPSLILPERIRVRCEREEVRGEGTIDKLNKRIEKMQEESVGIRRTVFTE